LHVIISGNIGLTLADLRSAGISVSRCRLRGKAPDGTLVVVRSVHNLDRLRGMKFDTYEFDRCSSTLKDELALSQKTMRFIMD